jgi:NAD-specific glutamate dehydrogenase
VHPYYVGVKIFDERGEVRGEHRFLGMLTSTARHEDVLDIPVINDRVSTSLIERLTIWEKVARGSRGTFSRIRSKTITVS